MGTRDRPPLDLTTGQRIKWLREKHGWTQRELGRRSNLGEARVAKMEAIKTVPRELDDLFAVATVLGVDFSALTAKPKKASKDVVAFPR